MVNEAEKYAEEDEIAKGKIAAKNSFESYIFNVKNTLDDEKLKVRLGRLVLEEMNTVNQSSHQIINQLINQ